jgi:hypothetical protein
MILATIYRVATLQFSLTLTDLEGDHAAVPVGDEISGPPSLTYTTPRWGAGAIPRDIVYWSVSDADVSILGDIWYLDAD